MKTRKLKQLLSLLLCACMVVCLTPATAWADDLVVGDNEDWRIDDTATLYIDSDAGMKHWIEENSNGMFSGIVYTVKLSEGITEIPYHAFWKCSQLTTIEIPASVTEMGKNDVFEGCSKLTEITVADGNDNFFVEDGVLYGYEKDDDGNKIEDEFVALICPPGKSGSVTLKDGTVEIGGSAFEACTRLTDVTLNEGLKRIGSNAFGGSGLQNVTLPASLTSLGNGVFDNCAGLTSVTVADGNTEFSSENGVLYDSSKTTLLLYPAAKPDESFRIPNSVTRIDSYAFKGARYLQTVTAGDLTGIESSAFMDCEALTGFTAKSLDEVKSQAFYECLSLETFALEDEDSLTTIGNNAFARCSSLTGAPLAGAASIGDSAFQSCTALTSLTFCETGNVTIGARAFSGCIGLTDLTFPESVKSIGSSAFGGCNKVTVITFESATPPSCYSTSFSIGDPENFQIVVPSGSESSYQTALGDTLDSYVGDTLVKKYPLFVNGVQLTSENTTIDCGSGTASFDVITSTLTLDNATIENMGGNYGYGGAINSGLAELTIKLVGTNTIHAEQEDYWGTIYCDSINSGTNCDVKIVSGESGGSMPTLICDLIDMGRGDSGFTGGAGEGNLTVDGVNLTVNDRIFVHHNATFKNGAQVNVTGGLTVNNSSTVQVAGEDTAVTVKYIALGNNLPGQTNQLVLDSGTLTITDSVAYPGAPDGDTNPYAIRFDPVSSGSIAINGGMFVKQASCAGTNIDESEITKAENLPVQGSWDGGTFIIGPATDGKHTVTVKSDPAESGVACGGGRYAENEKATLTFTAQPGWFFIGWYQDSGETAVSTSKSYEYTVETSNVTFTAKFIEDKLYQAEQAKETFDEAQNKDSLTWKILTDAMDAYNAVPDFLGQVESINGLLTENEKTDLEDRYTNLTTYYNGIEALDLSDQGIGNDDLTKLNLFTGVTDLNLSGNKGVTDPSKLPNTMQPETLDISGTGVTTTDVFMSGNEFIFSELSTLTAQNLSLTSISALAELVNADDFDAIDVTKWDFTGSTLPDTEDNKTDIQTIEDKLGDKFIKPTIKTNPPAGGGGGGTTTYSITIEDAAHGTVTSSLVSADKGATVTLTVTPNADYELDTLTVTDAKGNKVELTRAGDNRYTFTMPGSDVKIAVSFKESAEQVTNPFTDVHESDYYCDAVLWAVANGVTNGTSATTFSPDNPVSRAQMVTFLWRAYGSPKATGSNPFTDVDESAWYYDAVLWAVANGVTNGTSATTFSPDTSVTRAQSVTFQWRAAGSPEASGSSFDDVAENAYYNDAVVWAVANGITVGTGGNNFSPDVVVSRAQAVTFLYRELA